MPRTVVLITGRVKYDSRGAINIRGEAGGKARQGTPENLKRPTIVRGEKGRRPNLVYCNQSDTFTDQ